MSFKNKDKKKKKEEEDKLNTFSDKQKLRELATGRPELKEY